MAGPKGSNCTVLRHKVGGPNRFDFNLFSRIYIDNDEHGIVTELMDGSLESRLKGKFNGFSDGF